MYRSIDLIAMMKMYDRGNGRVRISAIIQELRAKKLDITEEE